MARIKDASVEEVKAVADMVAVVSARTQLRKTGGRYLGPHARGEQERARTTIRTIFDRLVERGDEPEQIVDFIAGMTDRFALTYVAELG